MKKPFTYAIVIFTIAILSGCAANTVKENISTAAPGTLRALIPQLSSQDESLLGLGLRDAEPDRAKEVVTSSGKFVIKSHDGSFDERSGQRCQTVTLTKEGVAVFTDTALCSTNGTDWASINPQQKEEVALAEEQLPPAAPTILEPTENEVIEPTEVLLQAQSAVHIDDLETSVTPSETPSFVNDHQESPYIEYADGNQKAFAPRTQSILPAKHAKRTLIVSDNTRVAAGNTKVVKAQSAPLFMPTIIEP